MQQFCGEAAERTARRLAREGREPIVVELTPAAPRWRHAQNWGEDWGYHIVTVCDGLVYDDWWAGEPPTWEQYIQEAFRGEAWGLLVPSYKHNAWTTVPGFPAPPGCVMYDDEDTFALLRKAVAPSQEE